MNNSHDVTARWIACYIAELMKEAECASKDEKRIKEEKCFETILLLWKHNTIYPDDSLPFRDYDAVFSTLKRIDPQNENTFYLKQVEPPNEDVKRYVEKALLVDKTVRIWFDYIFEEALKNSPSVNSQKYLKALLGIDEEYNTLPQYLEKLIYGETDINDTYLSTISGKLETLKSFDILNHTIMESLKKACN